MAVAFSCKGRGFCPSCAGRRMSELAAQPVHLLRFHGVLAPRAQLRAAVVPRLSRDAELGGGQGAWVAHCLDLDIVATGPTRGQAAKQLVEAVTAQIDCARDHQNYAYLYRPAPLEV
jgi:hypothetical protein